MNTEMNVEIFDSEFEQLAFYEISDDSEFTQIVEEAERFAASGIECCIRWQRPEDGQSAYWTHSGASFQPEWFN